MVNSIIETKHAGGDEPLLIIESTSLDFNQMGNEFVLEEFIESSISKPFT
jgi:hypothetical protein